MWKNTTNCHKHSGCVLDGICYIWSWASRDSFRDWTRFFWYFATNFKFGQKIYFQFLTAQMNSPKNCNFSKNWYTLGQLKRYFATLICSYVSRVQCTVQYTRIFILVEECMGKKWWWFMTGAIFRQVPYCTEEFCEYIQF